MKLRKWQLPDGRIIEPKCDKDLNLYIISCELYRLFGNADSHYNAQHLGDESNFTIHMKNGTTIKATLMEENMKQVIKLKVGDRIEYSTPNNDGDYTEIIEHINITGRIWFESGHETDIEFLNKGNFRSIHGIPVSEIERVEIEEENEEIIKVRCYEEIQEQEYQEITPENIRETLEYNGFIEVFLCEFKRGDFEIGVYDERYRFGYTNAAITHPNINKVLDFMSEFIGLKPLPKVENFESWFRKNNILNFCIVNDIKFYYRIGVPGEEAKFTINKSWPLEKQKQVCKQLMEIYSE